MKNYLKLLKFGSPIQPTVIGYALFSLLSTVFSLLNFTLLIPVLDLLFNSPNRIIEKTIPKFSFSISYFQSMFQYYFNLILTTEGKLGALKFTCLLIVASVLLTNLFKYLAQRTMTRFSVRIIKNIRSGLFKKLLNVDIAYFANERKGNIMSAMSNDINEIEHSVVSTLYVIAREPITLIGLLVTLFILSAKLTLFTFLLFPIAGGAMALISKKLRRDSGNAQSILGNMLSTIEETISGIKVIKVFNAKEYAYNQFDKSNEAYRKTVKSINNRRELASPVSELIGVLIVACILFYGGVLILNSNSELSPSQFIAYIAVYSQLLIPIKNLSQGYANIPRGMASAERIFKLLDAPINVKQASDAVNLNTFNSQIEFKNVGFQYSEEKKVLSNISFTIPKGAKVAFVGHSGAGKTTIADLIPRFYDVTNGEINIDGINIKKINTNSLYKAIAMVSQEAVLFNDTIANNVAFGLENISESDIVNACKIAHAHEFIEKLEHGYQTNIGDRGMKLSGGQRQRLSIARAVLKNAPILILDEATSALDSISERLIQNALDHLMQNKTAIIIAHRLSTIQNVDKIIVLEQGKIVEQGSHTQLLASNGVYKKLFEAQLGN